MSRSGDVIWRQIARRKSPSSLLCRNCLSAAAQRQSYSSASTTAASSPSPLDNFESSLHGGDTTLPEGVDVEEPASQERPVLSHRIRCAVLLSRPPLLTRDLTPFEKAFFLYQRRLNERLVLPFTRYFYYGKNSPGEVEWKRKIKERLTPSRDIGRYSGYGKEAWNDEVLVGSELSEPEVQKEALVKDSEIEVKRRNEAGEEEIIKEEAERPMPRKTAADETQDTRSLNRALTRTLYLLVKRKRSDTVRERLHGEWTFPAAELLHDESLHMAARRVITQGAGSTMNTWVVGKVPLGHQIYNYPQHLIEDAAEKEGEPGQLLGEKTFYMKARIMAGKPALQDNSLGLLDYQWLAKEEMQRVLSPSDWSSVKNIIAER